VSVTNGCLLLYSVVLWYYYEMCKLLHSGSLIVTLVSAHRTVLYWNEPSRMDSGDAYTAASFESCWLSPAWLPGLPVSWNPLNVLLDVLLMEDRWEQIELQTESGWQAEPLESVVIRDWQSQRCLPDSPKPDSPKLGFRVRLGLRVRVFGKGYGWRFGELGFGESVLNRRRRPWRLHLLT